MKKLHLFLLLAVIFSLFLSAQAFASAKPSAQEAQDVQKVQQAPETLTDFLVNQSVELTRTMGELARNESYIKIALPSDPEVFDIVSELGAGDYSAPEKAVVLSVSDESIGAIVKLAEEQLETGIEIDVTEETRKIVIDRMFSALPSMVNGYGGAGVDSLVASSVLMAEKSCLQPEGFNGYTAVTLLYESHVSATMFYISGEGVITANSWFLFLDEEMRGAIADGTVMDAFNRLFEEESVREEAEAMDFDLKMLEGIRLEYIDLADID